MIPPNKQIVYVEDDPIIFKSISSLLKEFCSPSIQSFDHPKKYLEAIKNGLIPDLIVTDIHMPYMNGFQMLAYAKNNYGIDVPVIITTGNPKNDHIEDIKDLNLIEFFQKPVDVRRLITTIQNVLS